MTHLVTIGGGGFNREPENPRMENFVLGLSGKARPRVCFIPTASGDDKTYIVNFYAFFGNGRSDPSHLPLHGVPRVDLREHLLSQDVIYVGGGNTANMLAVWRIHGVDRVLREAWERGIVLAGWSAGMICWYECGVTDSFGPLAALRDGLGFLPGSACPHYDGEVNRRPTYQRLIKEGLPAGVAADDGAALHFVEGKLVECVASKPTASCYRVECAAEGVREEKLPTRYLG